MLVNVEFQTSRKEYECRGLENGDIFVFLEDERLQEIGER